MTQEQEPNPWADGRWHEGTVLPDGDKGNDSDEGASEWMSVMLTAIIAGAVVLICLVCSETIASVASIIWGKS